MVSSSFELENTHHMLQKGTGDEALEGFETSRLRSLAWQVSERQMSHVDGDYGVGDHCDIALIVVIKVLYHGIMVSHM